MVDDMVLSLEVAGMFPGPSVTEATRPAREAVVLTLVQRLL